VLLCFSLLPVSLLIPALRGLSHRTKYPRPYIRNKFDADSEVIRAGGLKEITGRVNNTKYSKELLRGCLRLDSIRFDSIRFDYIRLPDYKETSANRKKAAY
jgi:hypothetical protein